MLILARNYSGWSFVIVSISVILCVIISLSLHEFAHAYVAYKCGDSTPKIQGRVSINPIKHIDPIGFLCCALFLFGWAKPVQINSNNFRNIKKGTGLTSIAGVVVNLILGFVSCGFLQMVLLFDMTNLFGLFLESFFYYMFFINISLAVFNILPIYPLDGFKVVENYTRYNNGYVNFMRKYGSIFLLIFIVFLDNLFLKLITYVTLPITLFWGLIF